MGDSGEGSEEKQTRKVLEQLRDQLSSCDQGMLMRFQVEARIPPGIRLKPS